MLFRSKKAFNIMDKYFPDEEEMDAGVSAANVDASGAFSVSSPGFIFSAVGLNGYLSSSTLQIVHRKVASVSASESVPTCMTYVLLAITLRSLCREHQYIILVCHLF